MYRRFPQPPSTSGAHVVAGFTVPNAVLLMGPHSPFNAGLTRSQFGVGICCVAFMIATRSGEIDQVRVVFSTICDAGFMLFANPAPSDATYRLIERLADRELEVFELIGQGLTTREIGERLHLGLTTVDTYKARIKEKLKLDNVARLRSEASRWVQQHE